MINATPFSNDITFEHFWVKCNTFFCNAARVIRSVGYSTDFVCTLSSFSLTRSANESFELCAPLENRLVCSVDVLKQPKSGIYQDNEQPSLPSNA